MLFWSKSKPNKDTINQANLDAAELEIQEKKATESALVASGNDFSNFIPTPIFELGKSCNYPLNVASQFPYWANIKPVGETGPNLIDLIQEYYSWIACHTKQDITPVYGFFELENFQKIDNLPDDLFFLYSKTFIPSIPNDALKNDVSIQELKTLINGIHKKLYSIKGSEFSFKYLISLFFSVTPDDISIVNPKKYLMLLNAGVNSSLSGLTSFGYVPMKGIGRLNYSILKDSTIWNEYTYIVNIKNSGDSISRERLENLIKPMLHPAGLNGLYQESKVIFNQIKEFIDKTVYETPKIKNYFYYTILSTKDTQPNYCDGCLDSPPVPTYSFPTWSLTLSDTTQYPPGVSFGSINIKDFWDLYPSVDSTFPNSNITCTGC